MNGVKRKVEGQAKPRARRSYQLGTLDKALTVLEALESSSQAMSLQQIAEQSKVQRLAVFRILSTLEQRGYVRRLSDKRYRATTRRRPVIGYMAPMTGNAFRIAVAASLEKTARDTRIDLLALDNPEDDEHVSIRNARHLVSSNADLVR